MTMFWDEDRVRELERSNQRQNAKLVIQEVRLKALETGEPPDVLALLERVARYFHDPYREPLLDYAIEILRGQPRPEIPPEALP
jgi:hypothetical protein